MVFSYKYPDFVPGELDAVGQDGRRLRRVFTAHLGHEGRQVVRLRRPVAGLRQLYGVPGESGHARGAQAARLVRQRRHLGADDVHF